MNFTTNEAKVIAFIKQEEEEAGWGPTLSEIAKALNQTKAQVKGVLGSLTAKQAVEVYEEDGFPTVYCSMQENI